MNVALWHNPDLQPGAFEGTETAALPTLRAECRLTATFQTRFRKALNAYT